MQNKPFLSRTLLLALLLQLPARAEPLVGIVGQNIRAFDSTSPGSTTFLATLAGMDIFEQVHAIERKPVSGELFVLTNIPGPTNQYKLRVAYSTGANTVLGSSFHISGSTKWAFALQPDNTTLRVVSNNGVNLRMDSATGNRTTDTNLAYAAGDVSFGAVPRVGALVTLDNGTTYGVDIANWNLVTLDPAPSGTLHTVGSTGLALTGSISVNLDISPSSGTAFLSVGNNAIPRTDLYTINLGTGALSNLGQLGNSEIFLAMAAGVVSAPPAPTTPTTHWAAGPDMRRNEKPDAPAHDDTANPNLTVPEWRYGSRMDLASSALTLFAPGSHVNAVPAGLDGFSDSNGRVQVNVGSVPVVLNNGPGPLLPIQPGDMFIHPESFAPFIVVRWTCPEAYSYDITAAWTDIDAYGGNGALGAIVVNGVILANQTFANGGAVATNTVLSLQYGDQVDFVLGANGDIGFDGTRFAATVSKTAATLQWTGGSGPTSLAANWNPARLPTTIDTVRIESGAPRVDTALNAAYVVNSQTVHFTNGVMNVHASLTNTGTLRLNTETVTFFGNLGIYGDGNIFMEDGTLASGASGDTLFNIGNDIQGAGFIPGIFVNQADGVVTAGSNGILHVDKPVANFGSMNAAGGSLLAFSGGQPATLDNTGGTIRANFGGAVFLGGPISGGEIVNFMNVPGELTGAVFGRPQQIRAPPTTGIFLGSFSGTPADVEFNVSHGFVTLTGTDSAGNPAEFSLLQNMDLNLKGTLVNNGVIRGYGHRTDGPAHIYVLADTVISGTGGIELGWGGRDGDQIIGVGKVLSLFPGQYLSGGGEVFTQVNNYSSSLLGNRASATEGDYPLRFYEPVQNYGLMRAENNGALDIHSSTLTQWSASYTEAGHVESTTGGLVAFHGTDIIGGALRQFAGQFPFLYHFSTLDGENAPKITLQGLHRAGGEAFDNLSVRGTVEFVDNALLEILGGSSLYSMGSPELIGSGRVRLGGNGVASDIFVSSGETLNSEITVAGIGAVTGEFSAHYWNRAGGRVQAHGGSLLLEITHLNDGVIEAGGLPAEDEQNVAGALVIGAFIDNLGTVRVNNSLSSLQFYGGSISGGTLKTLGGNTAFIDQFGRLESLDLINDIRALGATWCDLAGTLRFRPGLFPDSYVLAGGISGEDTDVGINGTVTLDGLGGVWLQDPDLVTGSARLVEGDTNPATVDKLILRNGARIRGAGLIDVDVNNESGTILSDTPGGKLIIADGRLAPRNTNLVTYTPDQITANPDLLQPDPALGLIQATAGATVEIQQVVLSGQQVLATGAGKIVLSGLSPLLGNLRLLMEDTSELVALEGLRLMAGVNIGVAGNELPGLPAGASCGIPTVNVGTGPTLRVQGGALIGLDGATLVAAGGGNLVAAGAGNAIELDGNASLVAAGGGNIVAAGGGNLVAAGGGNLVAAGGGNLVAAGGGNLVAAGGGNLVAAGGGNLVAAGGGNLVAAGGGNLVAAGGGNLANTANGTLVAAGGLNAVTAYGQLRIENGGKASADAGNVYIGGGNRNTTMMDNQVGGIVELENQSCLKVPSGKLVNSGTIKAENSNVVTGFFSNVGNAVVTGVTWAWNGTVGIATGIVNGVGGVINATGSFFGRLFGGAGLEGGGGGGFALAAVGDADASDFINDGTIILGDTICTNTFDMGFTQTTTGRLSVQLGGVATNTYDRLFINGPTMLGGVLQLVFTNNFAPALGDTFDFLVCPEVMSAFDFVEIAGLPAGHNWQFHALFTNGAYRVVSDSTVVLPLAAFRGLHGLAGDGSQDYANPSGDRVPNLFKYAFRLAENAGDLLNANSHRMASPTDTRGLPALFKTGPGAFELVFVRRKAAGSPGITYVPEITDTLTGTWTDLVPDTVVAESLDTTWERVRLGLTAPFDPPHDRGGHVRVRVQRN